MRKDIGSLPLTIVEITLSVLLLVISIGFSWYIYEQKQQIASLTNDKDTVAGERDQTANDLETASSTIADLEAYIAELTGQYDELTGNYETERERNDEFNDQIRDISKTVGVLDKLSKTDKELLQKYSKVYFLNEHYIPESLKEIDNEWKYTESKELKLHSKVVPYFEEMERDAKSDEVNLWVVSAYRSFGDQAALKGNYLVTYGSGANAFSADQGFSEHQLGTTIDFTTNGLSGGLSGFGQTPAYVWLLENAYRYGFTLSYPENNAYYEFEPWHWRFVGEKLARDLHKENAHFYDWEQRKIDAYLINIFD
jgi:zinc D-Ala-D-Ala carboxypeptidase